MTRTITKQDVLNLANDLNIQLTKEQVDAVLADYADAQIDDPTSSWAEVTESLIYSIINN